MKKVISLLILVLITSISVQAKKHIPITEDFDYKDYLHCFYDGNDAFPLDYGATWHVEVSNGGKSAKLTLSDGLGYHELSKQYKNVTTYAIFSDDGDFEGILITDNKHKDKPLVCVALYEGEWMVFNPNDVK